MMRVHRTGIYQKDVNVAVERLWTSISGATGTSFLTSCVLNLGLCVPLTMAIRVPAIPCVIVFHT